MLEWLIEKIRFIICKLIFKDHVGWYVIEEDEYDYKIIKCRFCGYEQTIIKDTWGEKDEEYPCHTK